MSERPVYVEIETNGVKLIMSQLAGADLRFTGAHFATVTYHGAGAQTAHLRLLNGSKGALGIEMPRDLAIKIAEIFNAAFEGGS